MDINKEKKYIYPSLLFFFEVGNEAQKQYCIRLKDNYNNDNKTIRYIIQCVTDSPFAVYFIINNKRYKIQTIFDDSDESLNETLNKIYELVDAEDTPEKSENFPSLECFYEKEINAQKEYFYKIKDNFKHEKSINFEIESITGQPFAINFIIDNLFYEIQTKFDDSDKSLNETLNNIYELLNKKNEDEEDEKNEKDEKDKKYESDDDSEKSDDNYPKLECFYESENEAQKEYCYQLRENFEHGKSINFVLNTSTPAIPFSVYFIINDKKYLIQEIFDDSDETLNKSLNKMYKLLDGEDIVEQSE